MKAQTNNTEAQGTTTTNPEMQHHRRCWTFTALQKLKYKMFRNDNWVVRVESCATEFDFDSGARRFWYRLELAESGAWAAFRNMSGCGGALSSLCQRACYLPPNLVAVSSLGTSVIFSRSTT